MQIVYETPAGTADLEVRLGRPDATVADLAAALGARDGGVSVDGRPIPGACRLDGCGLTVGALVRPAGAPPPARPTGRVVVRVVGGLGAGRSVPLPPGTATVGRDTGCTVVLDDTAVSRTHCRLEVSARGRVTVVDLGSRNGSDVNGTRIAGPTPLGPEDLLCVGGTVLLRVLPAERLGEAFAVDVSRLAGPGGLIPFSRAPRPGPPAPDGPVPLPARPGRYAAHTFGVSMIVGSLVMAAAFVVVTGDWRYAAIAALTPLMLVADWVESRTRGRRSLRRSVREFGVELARARERLAVRHAAEARGRRAGAVDPAEALFRAQAPSVRLWERRPAAPDFLELTAGVADVDWTVPVSGVTDDPAPEVVEAVDEVRRLPVVPVPVALRAGTALGLAGDRRAALAVARSLVAQAVATSGPVDLAVAVFTDPDRVADWDWTKWLPHVRDRRSGGSVRLLAAGTDGCAALARDLLDTRDGGPLLLAMVDGAVLLEGRPCPLRDLLSADAVTSLVLADRLPALCTHTLTVAGDGSAVLRRLAVADTVSGILATGMAPQPARDLARSLARFEDPELRVEGAGLPDRVALLPLLDLPDLRSATLRARWREGAATLRATAVLGVTEHGLFSVDLDDDGPHALVAGTTGSGKSELLRTLVASLAMGNDPEHLTFVLVDYKGGGALDECARLPHCVGLITDLDEQLGERALRCLEAELRYRERLLRQVGVGHLREYQHWRDSGHPDAEPMPRLVLVIDEFATLVKALPDFVDALVGIAQRGRSLGMHLVMATQRPAGSVSDAIKNNVKLRIGLRLESGSDSVDVIDSPVAAEIGGRQWGRAFHRVSARQVQAVQTALSTAVSVDGPAAAVTVSAFRFGPDRGAPDGRAVDDGPTDLHRLVTASSAAGRRPARRPWPEPLPARLTDLPAAGRGLQTPAIGLPAVALADDPEQQSQYPVGWDPQAGNLLLYGVVGAGTTTALATVALAWSSAYPPDRLHLYVLDLGAGGLAALARLPHCGAYIGAGDRERQVRLIRLLRRELDARKQSTTDCPLWMVLVDNIAALTTEFDRDLSGQNLLDDLARVYADGPAVGVHIAVTADRSGSVPHAWAALTQQRLLFRLADASEYSAFDVPRQRVPAFVPGRAVVAGTTQVVQVRWPGDDLAVGVAACDAGWPAPARPPRPVGALPVRVALADLPTAHTSSYPWRIPVGLDDDTLEPATLLLYEHEHVLVAGPARSGRSTALCALGRALATADRPPVLVALAGRRSPVRNLPGMSTVVSDVAELPPILSTLDRPAVLLVDDADQVADRSGDLDALLADQPAGLHVVAAGRADNLRRCYGHWTQRIRESRCGVLLIPDVDLDGDLLAAELSRTDRLAPVPGRGFLAMNGVVTGVQLAVADRQPEVMVR
jgi:DNA segregation ATPase FtsK/SpoIIIE, S-DNA-T family